MQRETKRILIYNLIFAILFLAGFTINRYILIVAAIFNMICILLIDDLHIDLALLLFVLPFSSMFNLGIGTTSLFMIPKLAFILKCFYKKLKLDINFFVYLLVLFMYFIAFITITENFELVRVTNLVVWFLLAYFFIDIGITNVKYESISFIAAVIVTSCVAFFKEYIPQLSQELISSQYLNSLTGEEIVRFSGLWNDPNGYTFFIIAALFCLLYLFGKKDIGVFSFFIISAMLSALGLYTLSKSCIIMIILFWMYWVCISNNIRLAKKYVIILLFIASAFIFASNFENIIEQFLYRFFGERSSITFESLTTLRSLIWKDYINEIMTNKFFFGHGIDAPIINRHGCHNTILQLFYDVGFLGFILYVGIWVKIVRNSRIRIKAYRYLPVLCIVLLACFVSCMYIEYFYFLIPLMVCISGKEVDKNEEVPSFSVRSISKKIT